MKTQTDLLRNIDLESVLKRMQAIKSYYDRAKWHTGQGTISVNGPKFVNWSAGIGGGGAIDLVMHLKQCDFKTAITWLTENFPDIPQIHYTKVSSLYKQTLILPARNDHKLPQVIVYLQDIRRIPHDLIQNLIRSEKLYADHRGNAVFLLLGKEKKIVGAELRGTTQARWHGMAKGSRKDLGCFYLKHLHASKAMICESAIDALSFFAINPDWLSISTSGANPNPAWIPLLLAKGFEVYCGFDLDEAGELAASKIMTLYPSIKRLRPAKHDWNDQLRSLPDFL